MTALVSAELLRLRTVRSPRWVLVAVLALAGVFAAGDASDLRGVALTSVLIVAVFVAQVVAGEFKRGGAALTYLAQPDRARVAVARSLTYAMLGGAVAAAAALVAVAVGRVGGETIDYGLQLVAGSLFTGAALSVVGVLVGTLTRNPTVAGIAMVAPTFLDGALRLPAVHAATPLGLVDGILGHGHGLSVPAAMGLLLVYPALLAVAARVCGLGRDLT